MITQKTGFLPLDGTANNIVHCIAQDRFCGAGFAAQIPKEHLAEIRSQEEELVGSYHISEGGGLYIVHLVTKTRSSDKPTRADFNKALLRFAADALTWEATEWNCPMMGAGLDKLSWTETEGLLKALPLNFNVWVPDNNPIPITA